MSAACLPPTLSAPGRWSPREADHPLGCHYYFLPNQTPSGTLKVLFNPGTLHQALGELTKITDGDFGFVMGDVRSVISSHGGFSSSALGPCCENSHDCGTSLWCIQSPSRVRTGSKSWVVVPRRPLPQHPRLPLDEERAASVEEAVGVAASVEVEVASVAGAESRPPGF